MTIKELKTVLATFPDDLPVGLYAPNDDGEPYKAIDAVGLSPFDDITIYPE